MISFVGVLSRLKKMVFGRRRKSDCFAGSMIKNSPWVLCMTSKQDQSDLFDVFTMLSLHHLYAP